MGRGGAIKLIGGGAIRVIWGGRGNKGHWGGSKSHFGGAIRFILGGGHSGGATRGTWGHLGTRWERGVFFGGAWPKEATPHKTTSISHAFRLCVPIGHTFPLTTPPCAARSLWPRPPLGLACPLATLTHPLLGHVRFGHAPLRARLVWPRPLKGQRPPV